MTVKNDVWMPLYVSDYLRDTQRLTGTQHGAYLLLLMEAWTHEGAVPSDDLELAMICRLTPREWKAQKRVVLGFWTLSEDGAAYIHKRVMAELDRARKITDKRSQAGKNGAAKRWQEDGKSHGKGIANGSQTDAPSPSPYSVPNGTGAEAPSIDPEKKAWADALSLLTTAGRMKDGPARAFIGKLKADNGIEVKDLLPAIGQAIANGTQDPAAYLRKAAAGISQRRGGGSAAPPKPDEITRDDWTRRIAMNKADGMWLGSWGPLPGERGCICPSDLLEA